MTQKQSNTTKRRTQYSPQFKEQALERAKRDGVPKAAKDLGISEILLYTWRKKLNQTGIAFEDQKIQKVEAIHGERFNTREEAKNHVFDYIDVYCNRHRLHSKLGYLSPESFERIKVA